MADSVNPLGDVLWSEGGSTSEAFVSESLAVELGRAVTDVEFEAVAVAPRALDRHSGAWRRRLSDDLVRQLSGYRRLAVATRVPLILQRSTIIASVERGGVCDSCGMLRLQYRAPQLFRSKVASPAPDYVDGVEWFERLSTTITALDEIELELAHHPRVPSAGLSFLAADLPDCGLWRPQQDGTNSILCTSRIKEVMERYGATNVHFLEVGSIVD